MKKLVIKTVVVTLAAIIAIVAALYLCFAVFAPKTLANFWEGTGNYSLSVKYSEKQYERSGDISDLADLCAKLNVRTDSARAVKYLGILVDGDGFTEFCENTEGSGYIMTPYEYYYGAFTVATYYESGLTPAIIVAKKAVLGGYTANNAFYLLLADADTLTNADGEIIAAEINGIKGELSDAEKTIAEKDIAIALSIK
ncbi:MAG: hypothetical protein J5911_00555 [Clostridia bacterium]|nr:hypothetical protein [Clostridia bacterium]